MVPADRLVDLQLLISTSTSTYLFLSRQAAEIHLQARPYLYFFALFRCYLDRLSMRFSKERSANNLASL